jgi:peptidoglycan/xylan/chitin deacetylase (PgdA/CDA1 family)
MITRQAKLIALTFDDGPGKFTPAVLDVLEEHRAKATFFLMGCAIEDERDVVARMARRGHEVGNHTFSHPRVGSLEDEIHRELRSTSDLIEEIVGRPPALFRPPYGLDGLKAVPIAKALGMTTVRWSVNPKDRDGGGERRIVRSVLDASRSGAAVLLHDGGNDREEAAAIVRVLVPELQARGYTLVTLSELLAFSQRARRQVIVTRRGPLRRAVTLARTTLRSSWPAALDA